MHFNSILKSATAVAAVLSLAGCLGGSNASTQPTSAAAAGTGTSTGTGTSGSTGGSSGGGTPSTQTAFDAKAQNYAAGLVPTSQPISGTASYNGEISIETKANAADPTEALIGSLAMGVNFDSGAINPVTATASGFTGNVNGQATTVTGSLSTANAISGDVNSVTATPNPVGTLTGVTATLRGTLSDPAGALSGDARMILNGSLKEAGGAKMAGGHQTTITPTGGGTSIATGGSLYADKN